MKNELEMQNPAFWIKTRRVYQYRLNCTGTEMQWVTCTGTGPGCNGTGHAVGNLYWYRSRVYRYRLCSG